MISSDGPSRRDETRDPGQRRRPPVESLHLLSAVVVWLVTGTTISSLNKWIFAVYNFRYPLLLSALHMLTAIVVDYGLIKYYFVRHRSLCQQDLTTSAKCKVFLLSLTFCASIAFGNLGLNYVQLSFAQMIYTTTPIFTLAISSLVLGKQHHVIKYTAMMPICIGASFSILGEVQFDQTGCLFVVAATMLRGVKSIQQSILLQEEKINSVLLLYLMAIPSFCILAVAALVLENWAGLQSPLHYDGHLWAFIVLSCLGSVLYNLASCCVISLTSAVTLHILGNLSLVGNLLLSQLLFGSQFSALSCAGAALTLSGMIIYQNSELIVSYVDARRTRTRSETNLVSGRMPEPKLEPFLEAAKEQSLEFSSEPFTELNTDPETSSDLYEDTEPYQELYQFKQEPSQAQDHDEEPYLKLSNILEPHSEPSGESFLVLDGDVEPSSQLFNREMFHAPEPVLSLDSDMVPSLDLSDDLEPASEPSRELYHDPELFNVLETSSKSSGKPSLNPEPSLSLVSDVELSLELSNVLESALGSSKKFHHDLEPLPGLNDHLEPFLERSESEQSSREQDHEMEPSTELSDILESAPESFKALWHNVTPSPEQSVTLPSKISTETEPSSEKPQEIDSDLMSSSEP